MLSVARPDVAAPLVPLHAAVRAGDWPAVAAFFADPAREHLVDSAVFMIGELDGVEVFLGDALVRRPATETLPRLLLAARLIRQGWGPAISADHLRRAERLLIETTARERHNAAAWTQRLRTARGLRLGRSEARRRYDECARLDPHRVAAQRLYLRQLSPMWGGSVELMFGFARECVAAAPPGAANGVLIADAHLERRRELPPGPYLADPAVLADLHAAARRSVRHPDSRPDGQSWADAHLTFASAFHLAGDDRAAEAHRRALETAWT
ncbi:hypothetical protein Val02_59980 [Virgisporangium aliadipatigenens]|uniref:Uncharacterized protein n=1 Tax=Virgisporangium aliadipatigenens TaxID=741659 RepID=A0A8J3YR65_9ACTN|nr:hypothetical protein [Virgisporangium aliadipatigenens]GIJ49112.1 hypothetical protein Val02_59980 [Virgisporangium aliadipatigenens]